MIKNIDRALDYIVKGQILKIDTIKILLDHENEETISELDSE